MSKSMDTVGDMGEFGLIDRVAQFMPNAGDMVVEGIGDDCAVLRYGDRDVLVSCDLSVEDVHFRRATAGPEDIGWKAAASALSDIAAMGGTPQFCLVALACPADTAVSFVDDVCRGLANAAADAGAVIVGGDTTKSHAGVVLDVTVIGEATEGRYLSRRGARPGDLLAVTGYPGCSAAGLHALERGVEAPALTQAHVRPEPRYAEGRWLCRHKKVHAMLDVSDGLIQDAGHLAQGAGLGVDIQTAGLSVADELARYCASAGMEPLDFILSGGEDYELAFAIAPDGFEDVSHAFQWEFDAPLSVAGIFTEQWEGVRVAGEAISGGGYDHFIQGR